MDLFIDLQTFITLNVRQRTRNNGFDIMMKVSIRKGKGRKRSKGGDVSPSVSLYSL